MKPRYIIGDLFKYNNQKYKVQEVLEDFYGVLPLDKSNAEILYIPLTTKGLRKIKQVTTARYAINDIFIYEEKYFQVIDIVYDICINQVQQYTKEGVLINEEVIAIPFDTVGMRKTSFKLSKEQKELQKHNQAVADTSQKRSTYIKPVEDTELDKEIIFLDYPDLFNIIQTSTELGLDIETFGNEVTEDASNPLKGEIRLIQFYIPQIARTLIIDLYKQEEKDHYILEYLLTKLTNPNCKIFVHNAAFECKWFLLKYGVHINNLVDSMILSQLLYAGLIRGFNKQGIKSPNSLGECVIRELNVTLDKTYQSFDYFLPIGNAQLNYAAYDAKYTYLLAKKLIVKCNNAGLKHVVKAELAAIPAFNALNCNGLPIDIETLNTLHQEYCEVLEKVIEPWKEVAPNLNLNSPKQLKELFLKYIPSLISTENPELTSHILNFQKQQNNDLSIVPYKDYSYHLQVCEHSLATNTPWSDQIYEVLINLMMSILMARSLKIDIGFMEKYKKFLIKRNEKEGILYVTYLQNAANVSGRTSCKSPNVQNITQLSTKKKNLGLRSLREIFKPFEDYSMIIVDFNGSHTQLLRRLTNDTKLVEAARSGLKEHFYTASGLLKMQNIDLSPGEIKQIRKQPDHPLFDLINEIYAASKTVFFGCVPHNTEILTKDGWKFRHEISLGDLVVSYNVEKLCMEWTPIFEIVDYPNAELVNLSIKDDFRNWSITVTPDHRWFGTRFDTRLTMHNQVIYEDKQFIRTFDIKSNDRILTSAKLVCDGERDLNNSLRKYNFDYIKSILSLNSDVRSVFFNNALIDDACLDQDGSLDVTQKSDRICDAMKLAAFLDGYRVIVYPEFNKIKDPYNFQRIKLDKNPWITGQDLIKTPVDSEDVWCVKTANSTFVIKQGETITITGNCLNINGAPTLQGSFLKKADQLVELEICKQYIDTWRSWYAQSYKFQLDCGKKANQENHCFEVNTSLGLKKIGTLTGRYAASRAMDGGVLYVEKLPSLYSGKIEGKITDIVSYQWLRVEATIIKSAMAKIHEKFLTHPEWNAQFFEMTHDEVGCICLSDYELIVADTVNKIMTEEFQKWVEDYKPDSYDPKTCIVNNWSEK